MFFRASAQCLVPGSPDYGRPTARLCSILHAQVGKYGPTGLSTSASPTASRADLRTALIYYQLPALIVTYNRNLSTECTFCYVSSLHSFPDFCKLFSWCRVHRDATLCDPKCSPATTHQTCRYTCQMCHPTELSLVPFLWCRQPKAFHNSLSAQFRCRH